MEDDIHLLHYKLSSMVETFDRTVATSDLRVASFDFSVGTCDPKTE